MEDNRIGFIKEPIIKGETSPWAIFGFLAIMLVSALITGVCIWASLFRKRLTDTAANLSADQVAASKASRKSIKKKNDALLP